MINTGKCPKCETTITSVRIEDVDVQVGFEPAWRGISYCCPSCGSVLSVQIDPVALKTDIINGVVEQLRH
jgi:hypothetical protein